MKLILSIIVFSFLNLNCKVCFCYNGQYFPSHYLKPDIANPSIKDFDDFLLNLKKTLYYNTYKLNQTDGNVALGTYLVTCILRRSLLNDSAKMKVWHQILINDLIRRGQKYISHYIYRNKMYGPKDFEFKVSALYKDIDIFAKSMNEINEKRLSKWISVDLKLHKFAPSMDNATLDKELFISIVESMDEYQINMRDSDFCLSRIKDTSEPLNTKELQVCRRDAYCTERLLSGPSVAYALTHRVLNIVLRRHIRRCYIKSPEEDSELLDQLCANMYREAVYLARRGYFARDLFLEHVALCSILGYTEFQRMIWFKKVISWMDENGCIKENPNYLINQTRLYKTQTSHSKKQSILTKALRRSLLSDCDSHAMTLLTVVLAQAVRYAAHFL